MKVFIHSHHSSKTINSCQIVHCMPSSKRFETLSPILVARHGASAINPDSLLRDPHYIQYLYQERNPYYMNYLDAVYDMAHDCDVISLCPGLDLVHPEFLLNNFSKALKCIHLVDDPHSTYNYYTPYFWAYDCATYISPRYNEKYTMKAFLRHTGMMNCLWTPHSMSYRNSLRSILEFENSWITRADRAVYIGRHYPVKGRRLSILSSVFGRKFSNYGRYRLAGMPYAILQSIHRHTFVPKPKAITDNERDRIYLTSTIGFNQHLSGSLRECGNQRTYELAAFGLAQVVDNVGAGCENVIFRDGSEVLVYKSIEEAIEMIRYLLDNQRIAYGLAKSAFVRYHSQYSPDAVFIKKLDWFEQML
jgi:hypothetical protein